MGAQRKKEVFEVCVKYGKPGAEVVTGCSSASHGMSMLDVIICEDDPYYFLQAGQYVAKDVRARTAAAEAKQSDEEWLASLAPSFLRYVVRLLFCTFLLLTL